MSNGAQSSIYRKALLLTLSRVLDWIALLSSDASGPVHVLAGGILVSTLLNYVILRTEPGHRCPPGILAFSQLTALWELAPWYARASAAAPSLRSASAAAPQEVELSSSFGSDGVFHGVSNSFISIAKSVHTMVGRGLVDSFASNSPAAAAQATTRSEKRARVLRKLMMAQLPEAIVSVAINYWVAHAELHELRWREGLARSETDVTVDVTAETFDRWFWESPNHIVRWQCPSCMPSHREIYYKRLMGCHTEPCGIGDFRPYDYMRDNWTGADNELHVDFDLFSQYLDAVNGQDSRRWEFCSLGHPECGFPGCWSGRYAAAYDQFSTFRLNHSSGSDSLLPGRAVSFAVERPYDLTVFMDVSTARAAIMHFIGTVVASVTLAVGIADSVQAFVIQTGFVQEYGSWVSVFYVLDVGSWVPLNLWLIRKGHLRYLGVDFFCIVCVVIAGFYGSVTRQRFCKSRKVGRVAGTVAFQLMISAALAAMLLMVNFLFFDTSSTFRWLNRCYYIIRFVLLAAILQIIGYEVPRGLAALSLAFASLLGFTVWFVVPHLRLRRELLTATRFNEKANERPMDGEREGMLHRQTTANFAAGYYDRIVAFARRGSGQAGAPRTGAGLAGCDKPAGDDFVRVLNELGDIFEALLLASRADSPRVRSAILGVAIRPLAEAGPELRQRLLPLILPQLLLSLRWRSVEEGADELCSLSNFLLHSALASDDMTLVAMVYWQLFALATDRQDVARPIYQATRLRLLQSLDSRTFNGRLYDKAFCEAALAMLANQRRFYYQLRLVARVAGQGRASHMRKTAVLRSALAQVATVQRWRGQPTFGPRPRGFTERLMEPRGRFTRCCKKCWKRAKRVAKADVIREEWDLDSILNGYEDRELDLSAPRGTSLPVEAGPSIAAIDASRSFVANSAAAPVVVCCELVGGPGTFVGGASKASSPEDGTDSPSSADTPSGFAYSTLHGRSERRLYAVKMGDDLRQDALVLQMFRLMDTAWAELGLGEVSLKPYNVIAVSAQEGVVAFVPKAVKVSSILQEHEGDVAKFINGCCADPSRGFDTLCGSLAGYSVATYLLGIGDRHLDNVMITEEGHYFHIDFGFVFGDDPRPFTPPVRIPREVLAAVQASGRYEHFRHLVGEAFVRIRRTARLWTSLLSLIASAGKTGANVLSADIDQGLCTIRERLHLELDEDAARAEILVEIEESAASMVPPVYDKVHQAGLFWK